MEQRSPNAWPCECPTCGSHKISATGVTVSAQQRRVTYRCLACGATWEHLVPPGRGMFDPPSTSPNRSDAE